MAFARASSIKVEIYRDMHFLSQHMFFPPLYLQFRRQTTYISPRTKKVKSNQNISNHCTKWTLGNFSCAWVIFHQLNSILHIGFCSIKCHFPENNLHVTMYYNCPTEKILAEECRVDWGFYELWKGLPINSLQFLNGTYLIYLAAKRLLVNFFRMLCKWRRLS